MKKILIGLGVIVVFVLVVTVLAPNSIIASIWITPWQKLHPSANTTSSSSASAAPAVMQAASSSLSAASSAIPEQPSRKTQQRAKEYHAR